MFKKYTFKTIRVFYLAIVSLLGLCGAVAIGNYTMTQGAGTTFGSIVVGGTVHYAQQLICDYVTPSQCANVSAGGAISTADAAVLAAVNSPIPAQANTTTNIGMVNIQSAANGGATPSFVVAANSNNSTNLKGSAGTVYSIQTSNINASTAYFIKLYDKATAPTCGTDTPVAAYVIPPSNGGNNVVTLVGKAFSLGIGYCIVTGIANNDNTSVPAATILANVDWK